MKVEKALAMHSGKKVAATNLIESLNEKIDLATNVKDLNLQMNEC